MLGRWIVLATCALSLVLFPSGAKAHDAPRLDGTWIVESATEQGKPTDGPVGDMLVFAGNQLSIVPRKEGQVRIVTYTIDASTHPHRFDMTHEVDSKELVVLGLIEAAGDRASICMSSPGAPRPTSIKSRAGTREHTVVLKRAPEAKTVRLFNGKDLTGWKAYLWDGKAGRQDTTTPVSSLWEAQDGVLVCRGRPTGYLQTVAAYENYKLALEWRWPEGTHRGNSGVLLHVTKANVLGLWPKSVEVQLYTHNAGDFWVIGTTLNVANGAQRKRGRRYENLTDDSERPIGQWNKMEVTCRANDILVHVNGVLVNHATDCSETRGRIALQSEGRPIHFRNIVVTPLAASAD